MTFIGDGLRGLATLVDGTTRTLASTLATGPIWGAVSSPTGVRLSDDVDGPRVISYEEIYRSQPVIFALVNTLTRQAARLPIRAYRGDPLGEYEALPATHSLARLIAKPAPGMTSFHLKQALLQPTLIHGNAMLGKYRANKRSLPTELLRLDWRFMNAYARMGGPIEMWSTTQTGTEVGLDPSSVIHVCWDPPSGNLGVSPLEALGTTVRGG